MITKNMKDSYYLTKAQYEARKQAGTLVEGATYHITDDTVNATTVGLDSTPTSGSNNLVTSGGIKSALDGKANTAETYNKNEVDDLVDDVESDVIPDSFIDLLE